MKNMNKELGLLEEKSEILKILKEREAYKNSFKNINIASKEEAFAFF